MFLTCSYLFPGALAPSEGWWFSPELYLRRPCELYEEYRLDRVLKRRGEAGVRVYIIMYNEVNCDLTLRQLLSTSILSPGYSDNEHVVFVDGGRLAGQP